jgi:hypothetical protein
MLFPDVKIKFGWSNLTNTVIIVSDITLRGYNYRQKTNRGLTHHVNSQKTKQFNIVWTGFTWWVSPVHTILNCLVFWLFTWWVSPVHTILNCLVFWLFTWWVSPVHTILNCLVFWLFTWWVSPVHTILNCLVFWLGLTHHVNSQKTRQFNIVWTTRQLI